MVLNFMKRVSLKFIFMIKLLILSQIFPNFSVFIVIPNINQFEF